MTLALGIFCFAVIIGLIIRLIILISRDDKTN